MNNWKRPNDPQLDATKVPDGYDVAWAAGIFEGEGHCRMCGRTKRGYMVHVTQKDPELLYRLRDLFGGSVRTKRNKSQCGTWDCCGDRARIFTALIYKYMTVRRKAQIDATEALDFLEDESPNDLTAKQLRKKLQAYYNVQSHINKKLGQLIRNGLVDDSTSEERIVKLLSSTRHYDKDMTDKERESYNATQKEWRIRRTNIQAINDKKTA